MSVTLRPLTEENLDECLSLKISDEEMNHAQLGELSEIREQGKEYGETYSPLTIYSGETMVGFIDYSCRDENIYQIHHFLIDENHRRHGYGEAGLRLTLIELFEKMACDEVTIAYMSFNDSGAIELYEKVGFIEEPADDEPGDRFARLRRSDWENRR